MSGNHSGTDERRNTFIMPTERAQRASPRSVENPPPDERVPFSYADNRRIGGTARTMPRSFQRSRQIALIHQSPVWGNLMHVSARPRRFLATFLVETPRAHSDGAMRNRPLIGHGRAARAGPPMARIECGAPGQTDRLRGARAANPIRVMPMTTPQPRSQTSRASPVVRPSARVALGRGGLYDSRLHGGDLPLGLGCVKRAGTSRQPGHAS